jgi:hypothetical protein
VIRGRAFRKIDTLIAANGARRPEMYVVSR